MYYPNERIKLIKYINKVLEEKKNEFLIQIEEINYKKNNIKITKLILKDDEGYDVKKWDLHNKTSLIIGKNSYDNFVDIDLTDNEYSHLISRNHGVINKVNDMWYYEDLSSINGSGIKKKSGEKIKLLKNIPYKLEFGDILYVGILRILIN